ncbi:MAG: hypothetical protein FD189_1873 [Elusimicrobia bacterium]|nr:MAG: hypothetical protein FD154_2050 [Elusimicrobiota bacterium]KAF0154495.1 MAG: hypothetical protein FD189_1873 [Elusimicrobiota bacterium]
MEQEKGWDALLALAFKAGITAVVVLGMGVFVGGLPFARELSAFGGKISAPEFINSALSLAVIAALAEFALAASPLFDRLLPLLPRAGRVASLLTALLCLIYAYHALQPSVYPFIPEFEWAYQAGFLGATLFVLARTGLLLHAAGGGLGAAAVGLLRKAAGAGDRPAGLDGEGERP